MKPWVLGLIVLLAAPNALWSADSARAKRVLMISTESRFTPAIMMAEQAALAELREKHNGPIEFYAEYLDANRFPGDKYQKEFYDYLREKFLQRPPDLVVLYFSRALQPIAKSIISLFPDVPIVAAGVTEEAEPHRNLGVNLTGFAQKIDAKGTIEIILQLQPDTQRLVVISGTSPVDRHHLAAVKEATRSFANRLDFDFWTDRSVIEMRRNVAALPPRTVILFTNLMRDGAGEMFHPPDAVQLLSSSANRAIYVMGDTMVGGGAVGGSVVYLEELGKRAARLSARVLEGTDPASLPFEILTDGVPMFDWRSLQRWGISEKRLPRESVVRFRPASIWEQYKGYIAGSVGLILVQAGLIFALLIQRKQRRRAQESLDERLRFEELVSRLSARFIHLPAREIDDHIVESLREVAEFLGFDFSSLSVFTGPAVGQVAFIWQAPGTPAMPANLTEKDFPWMAQELFARRDVSFLNPRELPEEARIDRATVERIHNCSVHCVPLLTAETPFGVLNVGTFDREQGIALDLLRRLRLLGEIFANALARKNSEQSLREEEKRLSLAASAAKLVLWTWNIQEDEIWVTFEGRALFGWGESELINLERFIEMLHFDDRKPTRAAIQKALDGNGAYESEYRQGLPDGTVRWFAARGQLEFDDKKKPLRMRGVSIDVTDHKKAEEELRKSEARKGGILDSALDGIITIDYEGRIIEFNSAAERIFGYSRTQVIGKPMAELIIPAHLRPQHASGLARYLSTGRGSMLGNRIEMPAIRADGTEFPVELSVTRIVQEGPPMFTGYVRDVSERKRAEAELQRTREALAHLSRTSTMGELAASVAHELNQPLGAILSNTEAAELFLNREPPALDEVREILADIRQDDQRASGIIRGMRALLRRQEIVKKPIELNGVVEEIVHLVGIEAAARKVSIEFEAETNLPCVSADRVHLQQVLMNLVLNGVEAMSAVPETERRLTVRTSNGDSRWVKIAVIDGGPGIPADRMPKLFEPFFTTKKEGLGMGLSIARTIVEAHQGRIWAENNLEGGATFNIALPIP